MRILKVNHKRIRAEVIKEYLGDRRAFAFSCGNATRWLKRAGVNLIAIDGEALEARRYITAEEADRWFKAFNATSGYLPTFLMERIAKMIAQHIDDAMLMEEGKIYTPFGSGELITCLGYLYPLEQIVGVFSQKYLPTRQDGTSPLESFVKRNCEIAQVPNENILHDILHFTKDTEKGGIFIDTSGAEE